MRHQMFSAKIYLRFKKIICLFFYFKDILGQDHYECQCKSCKEEKKYPQDIVNWERLGSVSKTILQNI